MSKSVLQILKALLIAACLWLTSETIKPGMMLIAKNSNAALLYKLNTVVPVIQWISIIYVLLEIVGLFHQRVIIDVVQCIAFLALASFLIKTFFIFW